jgi:coenzyme PQQ precursor peptide PqqA
MLAREARELTGARVREQFQPSWEKDRYASSEYGLAAKVTFATALPVGWFAPTAHVAHGQQASAGAPAGNDSPVYGGSYFNRHFLSSNQLDTGNAASLNGVCTFTVDTDTVLRPRSSFASSPIEVNGTLFLTGPLDQVVALDATTCQEPWKYEPELLSAVNQAQVYTTEPDGTHVNSSNPSCAPAILPAVGQRVHCSTTKWQFQTDAGIKTPAAAYAANGRQDVAVSSGGNSLAATPRPRSLRFPKRVAAEVLLRTLQRKEVKHMEWMTPDFEEIDTSAEVTAYAGRWDPAE